MEQKLATLLELIRIEGIVKMLWENIEHDALSETVQRVLQTNNDNIKSELERMTRQQLICVADQYPEVVTAELINEYYEQYRYGLKPGFTLYLLCGSKYTITAEQVFEQLQQQLNALVDKSDANIRKIRCKSYSILSDDLIELSMSFLKKHSYLDENETPSFVHELEEFFVWINVEKQYMAVKNVPDRVANTVVQQFRKILNQSISYIKLKKPVIDAVFGTEQRKGTYLKANATDAEAEKITISDSRLKEKEAVLTGLGSYDMASTYLEQTMDDNSINTLGINCEKGKIYLTKNVQASQFREWSVSAIQRIIPIVTDYARMDDFETFKARNVIDRTRFKCTHKQASVLERIVYGLLNGIRNGHGIALFDLDIREIWESTPKFWLPRHETECPVCGEHTYLYCPNCYSAAIKVDNSGNLFCTSCGEKLNICACDEGHIFPVENPYDTLRLVPTCETFELVSQIIKSDFQLPFSSTFIIYSNTVELYPLKRKSLLSLHEVRELKQVQDIELREEEYDELLKELGNMKEKCKCTRNDTCNKCTITNKQECLMKVFTTYPSYRPSPHNGHEFADVSFRVTVDGQSYKLVGVMKSAVSGGASLTRASKSGREMLQQVFSMCQDKRAEIIAAICPSRFQEQLEADLQYLSEITNKPIVIIDDMYMCKQLKAYRNGYRIS